MELKPKETRGQCTVFVHRRDFGLISNASFEMFLRLTAIQNRWIKEGNKWDYEQEANDARAWLSEHAIHRIEHPKSSADRVAEDYAKHWAQHIRQKIRSFIGW